MPAPRALIVGGGVAGLETALALRNLLGDGIDVQMHAPRAEFLYRPMSVGQPYGAAEVTRFDLHELMDRCGAEFRLDSVASVDPDQRQVVTHDGDRVPFDYLVITSGVRMLWAVPGAVTFWGVADEGAVAHVVERLRSGSIHSLAFTMPGGWAWSLPVYELALLAAAELERAGREGVRLLVATPEDRPLEVFGVRASEQVGELLEQRGIEVVTGVHPVKFEAGSLQVAPGGKIEVDVAVSMPRLEGRAIPGVPHDEDGFIPVDEFGRVRGLARVFGAGDVTTFPVKQGGIATQQADLVAEAIAAELGADVDPQPFDPILRGTLWTGGEPQFLYGRITGGHGDPSLLSDHAVWEHEGKIVGRHLAPFLAAVRGGEAPASSSQHPSPAAG